MPKKNIYEEVNARVLKDLESGIIPWEKPWFGTKNIYNVSSKKPYSFLNSYLLDKPGRWGTFKQWSEKGGKIKKGSKASQIVFWTVFNKKDKDDPTIVTPIPVLKKS